MKHKHNFFLVVMLCFLIANTGIKSHAQEDFKTYSLASKTLALAQKETYLNQVALDSLLAWAKKTQDLAFKIDLYNTIGFNYRIKNSESALAYLDKALTLNPNQQYAFGAFRSLRLKALCHLIMGMYPKARSLAFGAKNIADKINYARGKADVYRLVADTYDYEGNYLKALEYYLKVAKLCEEKQLEDLLALNYFSMAIFYENQENYQKAGQYLQKAHQIAAKNQDNLSIQYLNSLALNLGKQGKPQEAIEYLNKNLAHIQQINYPRKAVDLSITYHTLGTVYNILYDKNPKDSTFLTKALENLEKTQTSQLERNQFVIPETLVEFAQAYERAKDNEKAQKYYQKALENALIRKNQNTLAMVLNQFALFHLAQSDDAAAIGKANQALRIAEKIGAAREKQRAAQTLAMGYANQNQFDKAYQYQVRFKEISDSLYNQHINKSLLQAEFEYNFESQQKTLRYEMQKKDLANQTEITYQKRLRNLSLVAALLLLGLFYWVLHLYKVKKDNYQLVNQQKTKLELLNHKNDSQKRILEKAYRKMKSNHLLLQKVHQELQEKNEKIQAQTEELKETNEILNLVNLKLKETNEEVETQAEELRKANEEISTINANLEQVVEERTASLVKAYSDLAQTNTELDTFLYRSSHDLRRPLTTLMGLNTLAQMSLNEENAKQLFEKVHITATNMDKMLSKLLMIHDINHFVKDFHQVDFDALINTLKAKLKEHLAQYKVTWKSQIEPNLTQPSAAKLLQYILLNLIENAILYSKAGESYVHTHIYSQNNHLCLVVSDNGQGIDANYHNQIFDMFFRANEKSQGNGLGLYVVKKAVERLKGEITFESVVEKGSTFQVKIPHL